MSTVMTVITTGKSKPDWDELFAFTDRKAGRFDHRISGSPIWQLNKTGSAKLAEEVLAVIMTAVEIAGLSEGAFDPTVWPLVELWDFDSGGVLPQNEEILEALKKIDFRSIEIRENGEVTIPEGYGLDLGGIAKGAVVDFLAEHMIQEGYRNFLIEAGGDITVSGLKDNGQPWVVAIRHPRRKGVLLGVLSLGEKGKRISIVTSGDYERFFEKDGTRYHHILDPKTGFPSRGLVSVTVITSRCTEADALATAAFVLGPEAGFRLLQDRAQTEGLLVSEDGDRLTARVTSGFPLAVEDLDLE